MKTNFLLRNRRRTPSRKREILIVVGVLVAAALGFSVLGGQLSRIFAPLWHSNIYMRSGASNLVQSLRSKDVLIAENSDLKERLASAEELIISLRAIASSRDELLATFGRTEPAGILAGVLVHPPETPYDILVVDAGEDLDVRTSARVSTPEGVAVGTISDVLARASRVKFYSTAGERTDAVLERGGQNITLVGRGGGNFEFILPRDMPVEPGDRILLPELDASLVGVVGEVKVSPTDSFKAVLVRSPANPTHQRFVIIEP